MKYSEELGKVLEDYCLDLAIAKAPMTLRTYNMLLRRFVMFCHVESVTMTGNMKIDLFIRFIRHEEGLSRNSLRVYMAALRSFAKWLVMESLVPFGLEDVLMLGERLSAMIGRPAVRVPKVPDEADVQKLFEYVRTKPKRLGWRDTFLWHRNLALLESLRSTGARVGEIVSLYANQLDPQLRAAVVRGKGDKERFIFFDHLAWNAIMEYLRIRGVGHDDAPVFLRHDNARGDSSDCLSTRTVQEIFVELCALSGAKHFNPHRLRHRYATNVLATTGDLAITQDLLGHASPETTRVYAHVANSRLVAVRDLMEKVTV